MTFDMSYLEQSIWNLSKSMAGLPLQNCWKKKRGIVRQQASFRVDFLCLFGLVNVVDRRIGYWPLIWPLTQPHLGCACVAWPRDCPRAIPAWPEGHCTLTSNGVGSSSAGRGFRAWDVRAPGVRLAMLFCWLKI